MMVSRRDTVLALAATGAVAMQRRVASALDTDAQTHHTPINFRVPPGACDCHVHVFCDPRQFPFSPDRPYTPPPAPVEDLRTVLRALHMDRVVIVSPAVYGASNDCTRRHSSTRLRGTRYRAHRSADSQHGTAEVATRRDSWPATELRNLRCHRPPDHDGPIPSHVKGCGRAGVAHSDQYSLAHRGSTRGAHPER